RASSKKSPTTSVVLSVKIASGQRKPNQKPDMATAAIGEERSAGPKSCCANRLRSILLNYCSRPTSCFFDASPSSRSLSQRRVGQSDVNLAEHGPITSCQTRQTSASKAAYRLRTPNSTHQNT